jgi:dephospho-CoA kinase
MSQYFDYVVLVTADKSIRIKRIMERDKTSESEVSARMEKQLSEEKKKELADFVIENNGTQDELIKKCNFFLILFNSLTK